MRLSLIILYLTWSAWLWRAAEYALIGSFAPLAVFAFGTLFLILGAKKAGRWWRVGVSIWAIILILAGLARLGLSVALAFDPSVTVHGTEAQTLFHHASTALHVIGGFWLLLRPPEGLLSLDRKQ